MLKTGKLNRLSRTFACTCKSRIEKCYNLNYSPLNSLLRNMYQVVTSWRYRVSLKNVMPRFLSQTWRNIWRRIVARGKLNVVIAPKKFIFVIWRYFH